MQFSGLAAGTLWNFGGVATIGNVHIRRILQPWSHQLPLSMLSHAWPLSWGATAGERHFWKPFASWRQCIAADSNAQHFCSGVTPECIKKLWKYFRNHTLQQLYRFQQLPLPLTSHRRRMSCHGATFCKSGEISFTQMNMILWRWDIVCVFPFVLLSYVLWCWLCWWRRFSLLVARNRISVMKAASCARPISTGLQCRRCFNRLTL